MGSISAIPNERRGEQDFRVNYKAVICATNRPERSQFFLPAEIARLQPGEPACEDPVPCQNVFIFGATADRHGNAVKSRKPGGGEGEPGFLNFGSYGEPAAANT
jgi:hypothetical protein